MPKGEPDRTGNVDADFVREHVGWMLAVARRILADEMHAEDAVQNAFAKIFLKIDDFEGRSALKTWMHRIVVNEALIILRSITRKKETAIESLLPQFDGAGCRTDQKLIDGDTPEMRLQSRETTAIVQEAIARLPEKFRIVLILRDIEGFSTEEVATALQLNVSNVKVRLHRARAALKKLLEPTYGSGK